MFDIAFRKVKRVDVVWQKMFMCLTFVQFINVYKNLGVYEGVELCFH